MIRVNFTFGHLDKPDSVTSWGFDISSASDRDSDGSPEGGDGESGSVRSTTARAEGIAENPKFGAQS